MILKPVVAGAATGFIEVSPFFYAVWAAWGSMNKEEEVWQNM